MENSTTGDDMSVNCEEKKHHDKETDKPSADEHTSDSQGCVPVQPVKEKGRKLGSVSAIPDDQYNFIIGILEGHIQLNSISKNKRTKAQKAAIMRLWRNKGLLQVAKVHNPLIGKKEKRLISKKDARIILRESERAIVTQKYHQNHKGNGARRLFGVVKDSFIGCSRQSIQSDLKKFKVSQERKLGPSVETTFQPPLKVLKEPQERHQIEIVSLEGTVKQKAKTCVLVVQDVFSKFVWLRPVTKKDSVEITHHLMALYSEYGPPQELLFDHKEKFYDTIKQMCVDLKIQRINGVVTRCQCEASDSSDGLWKEKMTLDLFQFANSNSNWVEHLPSYQQRLNEERHQSLGMLNPFELFFGRTSNTLPSKMCLGENPSEVDMANVSMKLENEFSHEALDQLTQQSSGTPVHTFANTHFMENILQRISSKSSSDCKALHAFINTHLKLATSKDSVNKKRDDLIAHAMELGYFERGDTPRDSNCLFHVLVDQLSRAKVNSRLDHRQLRHQLVDHLRRNPTNSDGEHLQSFLYVMTWEEYLNRMEENEWGDQFILQAFSSLYQATIHIISSLGENYNYIVTPIAETPRGQELILGHMFERHYISLEPLDSLSPENSPLSVLHPASDTSATNTHVVVQQVETSYEDVLHYFAEKDSVQKRSRVVLEREDSSPSSGFTRICTRGPRSRFFLDFMNESGRQYTTNGTVALIPEEDMQIYNGIDDVIAQSLSDGDWIEEICPPFIYWVTRVRSLTRPVQRLSANVAILLHAECDEYRSWCLRVKDSMPHALL
ncbi:uncharacterized protein [Asterias amurensis]|uniref:uncharacterized protein n=1 Tax=Asterias amurensis TaxID=7602 RepID=UPI003AB84DA8